MMSEDEDAALFGGAHRALTFIEAGLLTARSLLVAAPPNIGTGVEGIA